MSNYKGWSGVEQGATPIGNMKSLEAIAKEVNDRNLKILEEKRRMAQAKQAKQYK